MPKAAKSKALPQPCCPQVTQAAFNNLRPGAGKWQNLLQCPGYSASSPSFFGHARLLPPSMHPFGAPQQLFRQRMHDDAGQVILRDP